MLPTELTHDLPRLGVRRDARGRDSHLLLVALEVRLAHLQHALHRQIHKLAEAQHLLVPLPAYREVPVRALQPCFELRDELLQAIRRGVARLLETRHEPLVLEVPDRRARLAAQVIKLPPERVYSYLQRGAG